MDERKLAYLKLPTHVRSVQTAMFTNDEEEGTLFTYKEERKAVTRRTLRKFLRRWAGVWQLPLGRKLSKSERMLVSGKWSAKKLFKEVRYLKDKDAILPPMPSPTLQMAMHIAMPVPFLKAFFVARQYGVSSEGVLLRMFVHSQPGYEGWGY